MIYQGYVLPDLPNGPVPVRCRISHDLIARLSNELLGIDVRVVTDYRIARLISILNGGAEYDRYLWLMWPPTHEEGFVFKTNCFPREGLNSKWDYDKL